MTRSFAVSGRRSGPSRSLARRLSGALAAAALALPAALTAPPPAAAAELVMFEEPGCVWCARWNEEVGDAYHLTEEGERAPLRRRDIRDGAPEGVTLDMPAQYTPTFVLVQNGAEIGRIEGYPGEDFFWPMLNRLLSRLPAPDPAPEAGTAASRDAGAAERAGG